MTVFVGGSCAPLLLAERGGRSVPFFFVIGLVSEQMRVGRIWLQCILISGKIAVHVNSTHGLPGGG